MPEDINFEDVKITPDMEKELSAMGKGDEEDDAE